MISRSTKIIFTAEDLNYPSARILRCAWPVGDLNVNYDTMPKSARDFEIWIDDVAFIK